MSRGWDGGIGETERISVYRHSANADSLNLGGRYSRNPEFCKHGTDEYLLGAMSADAIMV